MQLQRSAVAAQSRHAAPECGSYRAGADFSFSPSSRPLRLPPFPGFARREASIPAHTMHVSSEPFQGTSTTKADFQRWSARPAEPIRPVPAAAPSGKDDRTFATEAGSKFNPKGFVARQPAIPFSSHVFADDESRSFETEHSSHYAQPPPSEPCPSDALVRENQAAAAMGKPPAKAVAGHLLYHHDAASNTYRASPSVDALGRLRL